MKKYWQSCKVREIIFEQKEKVEEILNNKKSLIVALSDKLLEKETLLLKDLDEIFN